MRHHSSQRNSVWNVLFILSTTLSLHACGDTNNAAGPLAPAAPGSLTILTSSPLPAGTTGATYDITLEQSGGTPPYIWNVAPGSPLLPNGLVLTPSTGRISGTPTTTGTIGLEFILQDSNGQSVRKVLFMTINIVPTPLAIITNSLAPGTINQFYAFALSGTGGTTPYTWNLKARTPPLPSGLTLSTNGVIIGTPTVTSTATHTFTLTDATSLTVEKDLPLAISSIPLSITTTSLPLTSPAPPLITGPSSLRTGTVNQPYPDTQFTATGGVPPYSWSVYPALPNGLTLNPSSGVITGTPLSGSNGNSLHEFTVTDSTMPINQQGKKTFSLTISANVTPVTITTRSLPNGSRNQPYAGTVEASGGVTPYTWSATPPLPVGLTLAPATGEMSGTPTTTSNMRHDFTVRDSTNQTSTSELRLRVRNASSSDDDD